MLQLVAEVEHIALWDTFFHAVCSLNPYTAYLGQSRLYGYSMPDICTPKHIYANIQKFGVSKIFFKLIFSPRLHLF